MTAGLTRLKLLPTQGGDAEQARTQQTQGAGFRNRCEVRVAAGEHDRNQALRVNGHSQLYGHTNHRNVLVAFDKSAADRSTQRVFFYAVAKVEELPRNVAAETAGEDHAVRQSIAPVCCNLKRAAAGESSARLQVSADQRTGGKGQGP